MKRNIYIAYALWFFSVLIGGGLHRIYCGKFISGFIQLGLYWIGIATVWIFIGFIPLIIWGLWWIIDVFLTGIMVEDANVEFNTYNDVEYAEKIKSVEALYDLYKKGAISKEEYEIRKDILMKNI